MTNFFLEGGRHLKIWRISIKNMGVLASLLKIRNSGKTGSTFPLGDPQLELVRAVLASEAWWRPSLMGTWYPWGPSAPSLLPLSILQQPHPLTHPHFLPHRWKHLHFQPLEGARGREEVSFTWAWGKGLEGEVLCDRV